MASSFELSDYIIPKKVKTVRYNNNQDLVFTINENIYERSIYDKSIHPTVYDDSEELIDDTISFNAIEIHKKFYEKVSEIMMTKNPGCYKFHFETLDFIKNDIKKKYLMDGPTERWIHMLFFDALIHFYFCKNTSYSAHQTNRKNIEQRSILFEVLFDIITEKMTDKMLDGTIIGKPLPDKLNIIANDFMQSYQHYFVYFDNSNIYKSGKTAPIFQKMCFVYHEFFQYNGLNLKPILNEIVHWVYNEHIRKPRPLLFLDTKILKELLDKSGCEE